MMTATMIKYVVMLYIVVGTFHIVNILGISAKCYFLFNFVGELIGAHRGYLTQLAQGHPANKW